MRNQQAEKPLPTPREIYNYLNQYVIGQEAAKKAVSVAAYSHLKRCQMLKAGGQPNGQPKMGATLRKSNMLLIGPTGCGKTHLARHLANFLEVPFAVVDATEYTEAGYYGKDVEVMIAELLFAAGHNTQEAERGIIFVDEIDKIARRSQAAKTGAGSRDIGGEGVQQGMLKLLEGRDIFVPMNVTQHWNKHDFVQMDTRNILFICAGTFSDLQVYGGAADGRARTAGFVDAEGENLVEAQNSKKRRRGRRISNKDLIEFGLIAEFLGRLPVVVELEELEASELLRVLCEPPDNLVDEYRELLRLDEVELHVTRAALQEIVKYSIEKQIGARGLRSIFEQVCQDLLFTAPEQHGRRVTLDAQAVRRKLSAL